MSAQKFRISRLCSCLYIKHALVVRWCRAIIVTTNLTWKSCKGDPRPPAVAWLSFFLAVGLGGASPAAGHGHGHLLWARRARS